MKLRLPYAYQQALWFLLACVLTGGCLGVLVAALKPWRP